ncbi:MAG: nitroreductase family protein [Candidatus Limnocylindrales bacterium]
MADQSGSASERVRPLTRVRQIREFDELAVAPSQLDAIADVARWSGSSANSQPWRFVVLRDRATIKRIADAAMPQARALQTAPAAIAIVLPDETPQPGHAVSHAFDEGRAAERILIAASTLGMGAGIGWILPDKRDAIRAILGLPEDRFVRTIVAIGHPSEAAKRPKSAPGAARLPRNEVVFEERWPKD